jgi:hypothetical protein
MVSVVTSVLLQSLSRVWGAGEEKGALLLWSAAAAASEVHIDWIELCGCFSSSSSLLRTMNGGEPALVTDEPAASSRLSSGENYRIVLGGGGVDGISRLQINKRNLKDHHT